MTEEMTGGVTTCSPNSTTEQLVNTAGKGLPGLELTILDARRHQHRRAGDARPGVFVGYRGQEYLCRSEVTGDGYFRTGNLGRLDEHCYGGDQ